MQSALQTALGDAMTASESRRGEGESDGGEVCLVLLIVLLPFSFRRQRLGRARKEDPLSRTGTMARSEATSEAGPAEKTARSVSLRHGAAAASCSFGLTRSCPSFLPLSLSFFLCAAFSLAMYNDGCNWPCRPLDRSVQAQRSRARRATALPPPHVVRPCSPTAPCARLAWQGVESTLKMALGEATTLSKSRRGGEESDGGEVCLVLLIVSPFPPSSAASGRARKEGFLSRTGTMARSEAISAPQTGKDGCTLGRLEARSSCSVVLLWSHLTLPLPSSFSFLLCCSSACVCCDILHG